MKERIGFYICHCGINIAYRVRCEEVAQYIGKVPEVAISRDYLFMCSDPGQEIIEKDIAEYQLTRVVVASCSPRMHENTFRAAVARGGLNPFRAFHHVCVREHVSWVHENEDVATEKAKELSLAGVLRVVNQIDLFPASFSVTPAAMVVGGGIAGMQASLDIASAGYKVYLVEKQATIGGHMLQYDKTFPTLDCAACIGTPKMVSVAQNPNIELLTLSEVENVSGFIGNYTVRVKKRARYIDENKCTGCGECTTACIVDRPNEWDMGMQLRKAVYRPFPQAVPPAFAIEKMDRGPCVQTCPAGTNVQGYVSLIGQGKYEEAMKIILDRLPIPGTLGRVCPAPCEAMCRRKDIDESVSIRNLKRFACDQVPLENIKFPPVEVKNQKVAVVGSGPGGLSAAYFLARMGYPVTVFESQPKAGGMLRYGIPDYRLPQDILDKEIEFISKVGPGVEFKYGVTIGKDVDMDSLQKEGYKSMLMAIGAQNSLKLGIPGEELDGVCQAIDLLKAANAGKKVKVGKNVFVIGGGNAAVDAARTVLRLGAEKVSIIYRRTRAEMPAYEHEIEDAEKEGIEIQLLTTPNKVIGKNGAVKEIEFIRMELGEPDDSGRRRPLAIKGSEFTVEVDMVIPAIGQRIDAACLEKLNDIERNPRGYIQGDPVTHATSCKGVFVCGDAQSGPATVVEAVAAGREAAISIDRYFRGVDLAEGRGKPAIADNWAALPKYERKHARYIPQKLDPKEREGNFDEVELAFDEEQAKQEAKRCISCGVCSECMACVAKCEAKAIVHDQKDEIVEIDVGSIIVATGFDTLDASSIEKYGYGKYPNVFTNLEFERLSNATGPTSGKLLMRDPEDPYRFTDPPESVAILHCIGSRDVNYHEYCSRTCCMYALKYAHLLKDKVGHDVQVYNFYIDMRCFGKGYEEFYKRVQSEGVRMIRGKASRVTDILQDEEEEGKLIVIAEDTLSQTLLRVPVDMVVLCTAMEPQRDAMKVSSTFGISIGGDGFFLEEHPKLEPVSTATSGVFLAGACQSPKDIPDTVAQAKAAASMAQALISIGEVEVSPMISSIDSDLCAGCQVCIGLCPYSAIEFDTRHQISVVNSAVCKGCGSCAAHCPSGAAKIRHFTDKQIFAEVEGLMTIGGM